MELIVAFSSASYAENREAGDKNGLRHGDGGTGPELAHVGPGSKVPDHIVPATNIWNSGRLSGLVRTLPNHPDGSVTIAL